MMESYTSGEAVVQMSFMENGGVAICAVVFLKSTILFMGRKKHKPKRQVKPQ